MFNIMFYNNQFKWYTVKNHNDTYGIYKVNHRLCKVVCVHMGRTMFFELKENIKKMLVSIWTITSNLLFVSARVENE